MLKRISMAGALFCMILGFVTPLFAVHGGDVIIGQELVLRIRFPAGGYTIQERADSVTQRINNLLGARPFYPNDVRVVQRNKEWAVVVGTNLIITADARTAAYNKTTPRQLAEIWAANLRRVIPRAKAPTE